VEGDFICDYQVNQEAGDMIPTQTSRVTFTDGRSHSTPGSSIIGSNDEAYLSLILGMLGGENDAIDGTCSSIDFDAAWV